MTTPAKPSRKEPDVTPLEALSILSQGSKFDPTQSVTYSLTHIPNRSSQPDNLTTVIQSFAFTMPKPHVDYHLYLVTDSTPAVLKDPSRFFDAVEQALRGGVSLVQLREKTADTGELVSIAKRLHELTKKYNVPLLINDRVDVALAVGCEGVHIGQDDMGEFFEAISFSSIRLLTSE